MGLGSRVFFGLFETSCYICGREFFRFLFLFLFLSIILILLVIFVDRRIFWSVGTLIASEGEGGREGGGGEGEGMQTALKLAGVTSFFFVFLGTFFFAVFF